MTIHHGLTDKDIKRIVTLVKTSLVAEIQIRPFVRYYDLVYSDKITRRIFMTI